MANQYLTPEGWYVEDGDSNQYMLPSGEYLNGTGGSGSTLSVTADHTIPAFTNAATMTVVAQATASQTVDAFTQSATMAAIVQAYGTRINWIRNNTMQGAAAGTPGTLPTNWSISGLTGTLAYEVVGTATESDVECIDIKFTGTTSGTTDVYLFFETATGIRSGLTSAWVSSVYTKSQSGSSNGLTESLVCQVNDAAGAAITEYTQGTAISVFNRRDHSRSLDHAAGTQFIQPGLKLRWSSGRTLNWTMRVGLPQFEKNGSTSPSTVIRTTDSVVSVQDMAVFTQVATLEIPPARSVTASHTMPVFTQAATAVVLVQGTADQTMPVFTQTATAAAVCALTASHDVPVFSQSATATVTVSASASHTVPDFTQSATAVAIGAINTAQQMAAFTQAATAAVIAQMQAAQTLSAFTQVAALERYELSPDYVYVPVLDRHAWVPAEDRDVIVPVEDRRVLVPVEDRHTYV